MEKGLSTGREVLTRALQLLGYTNGYGEVDGAQDAELLKRGRAAVAQIFTDLYAIESPDGEPAEDGPALHGGLPDMDSPLPLSPRTLSDVMPYGVAMLLAQSESDGDSQGLFSILYNRKRAGVTRPSARRRDVLPWGGN